MDRYTGIYTQGRVRAGEDEKSTDRNNNETTEYAQRATTRVLNNGNACSCGQVWRNQQGLRSICQRCDASLISGQHNAHGYLFRRRNKWFRMQFTVTATYPQVCKTVMKMQTKKYTYTIENISDHQTHNDEDQQEICIKWQCHKWVRVWQRCWCRLYYNPIRQYRYEDRNYVQGSGWVWWKKEKLKNCGDNGRKTEEKGKWRWRGKNKTTAEEKNSVLSE